MAQINIPASVHWSSVTRQLQPNPDTLIDASFVAGRLSAPGFTEDELLAALEVAIMEDEAARSREYRILAFAEGIADVTTLDYKVGLTQRLAPKTIFNDKGVLIRIEYYPNSSLNALGQEVFEGDVVVSEDDVYFREGPSNALGVSGPDTSFALFRDKTISWYRNDGTIGASKTLRKTYGPAQRLAESERRRRNVIDLLQQQLLGLLIGGLGFTQGETILQLQTFDALHLPYTSSYLSNGNELPLIASIASDTEHPWLDVEVQEGVTVRQVILSRLT